MFEQEITLPAGEYWIGDPCYVMHAEWNEICNDFFFADRNDNGVNQGAYTLADGRRIYVANTAYGDGCYNDNLGNQYGVDAGCIGIIALADIDQTNTSNSVECGTVHTFPAPFTVTANGGVFVFGDIVIDTAYEEEEEKEEEWLDEWDCDPMDESETW